MREFIMQKLLRYYFMGMAVLVGLYYLAGPVKAAQAYDNRQPFQAEPANYEEGTGSSNSDGDSEGDTSGKKQ